MYTSVQLQRIENEMINVAVEQSAEVVYEKRNDEIITQCNNYCNRKNEKHAYGYAFLLCSLKYDVNLFYVMQ